MPDPGPLNALRARMAVALEIGQRQRSVVWGEPGLMSAALKDVKQVFGGDDDGMRPERGDLVEAVRNFFRGRQVASFTELKYICHGVTVPVNDAGQRLIDRSALFARLLELVDERQAQAKQFRRCFQGLMTGYFGFERDLDRPGPAQANWMTLRGFLGDRLVPIDQAARARGRQPEWLQTLALHKNLLGDQPCERYAEALRRGDRGELAGVCKGLSIESNSWVWHEAMMAYVKAVVRAGEPTFKSEMGQVLAVVDGQHPDLKVPAPIARDAAALVVAKYERCNSKPEHAELRDVCLRRIGNPWLERVAWDSAVGSEPARVMVESWLKRRLIRDFFELLAHEGAADLRRLNYWLKWEPKISDMWFVLGTNANHNRTEKFLTVRRRMAGRDRVLTSCPDPTNNAFVMRVGALLIIEFGAKGNACFVFDSDKFATSLELRNLSLIALKQKLYSERLIHNGSWEESFDFALRRLTGDIVPAAKTRAARIGAEAPKRVGALAESAAVVKSAAPAPSNVPASGNAAPGTASKPPWPAFTPPTPRRAALAAVPDDLPRVVPARSPALGVVRMTTLDEEILRRRCREEDIDVQDNRAKGGAFWLRTQGKAPSERLTRKIESHGFKWVAGKGYCLGGDD